MRVEIRALDGTEIVSVNMTERQHARLFKYFLRVDDRASARDLASLPHDLLVLRALQFALRRTLSPGRRREIRELIDLVKLAMCTEGRQLGLELITNSGRLVKIGAFTFDNRRRTVTRIIPAASHLRATSESSAG